MFLKDNMVYFDFVLSDCEKCNTSHFVLLSLAQCEIDSEIRWMSLFKTQLLLRVKLP